jgi:hypothetical protein
MEIMMNDMLMHSRPAGLLPPAGDPRGTFQANQLDGLPAPAAAFLQHAIAPGTALPHRVSLTMHGHIKAMGVWLPFRAEQVIDHDRGFWWTANIAYGLLRGGDSFDHDQGQTRFALGGIVPIIVADGADVTRSALGRFIAEQAIWLPGSLLPSNGAHWSAVDGDHADATVPGSGTYTRLRIGIEPDGAVHDLAMSRWGRTRGRFGWMPFGMVADAEASYGHFTLVSQGRVGWWYGTPRGRPASSSASRSTTYVPSRNRSAIPWRPR